MDYDELLTRYNTYGCITWIMVSCLPDTIDMDA
jgi:hypothetical protein